jgi:hypothetical protein
MSPDVAARELYVYYRTGADAAAAVRAELAQLFAALTHRHVGLRARLLQRPGTPPDMHTWMEVYTHPQGISPQLQAEIEAAANKLPRSRLGARHAECFEGVVETPAGMR